MQTWPIIPERLYVAGFIEPDWSALRELKVDLLIDVAGELSGVPRGLIYVSYPIADVATWWGAGPLATTASQMLNPHVLDAIAAAAVAMMRRGHVAAVACMAGMNRSPLMAALIVRHYIGCSGMEAIQIVRKARPGALENDTFAALLRGLEAPK